jgi:hypothetical protein
MMKYGESGSSDEDGSGSGSDDETEEEKEDCQVLLNWNPSKRQRQEEKLSQENVPLVPKVEGIPETSNKDQFEHIYNVLGEMQAEHRMRGELLREACQIADCTPSDLPDWIRKMVVVATQDRVFPYYAPNSSIKHSKSNSKDRSQEIL